MLVLLDLNEFVSGLLGQRGVLSIAILCTSIFLIIISKPKIKSAKSFHSFFIFFFIGYLILGSLATILENNAINIWPNFRYYMPSLIIYYATYRTILSIDREVEIFKVLRTVSMLISLNAILIIISIFFGIDFHVSLEEKGIDRAVGLYSNANRAGYVAVIGQLITLVLLVSGQVLKRWLFQCMYLICLAAAVSTFSKGSIILSLLILLFFIFLGKKNSHSQFSFNKRINIRRILLILVVIVPFSMPYIYYNLSIEQATRINQVGQMLSGTFNNETTTDRLTLVHFALSEIKDNFFLGAGLGEFKKMSIGLGTHNTYLLILGESGVIAIILYLRFLLFWLHNSLRMIKDSNPLEVASLGMAIIFAFVGFASHTLLVNKSFVVVLGIIFAAVRINRHARAR